MYSPIAARGGNQPYHVQSHLKQYRPAHQCSVQDHMLTTECALQVIVATPRQLEALIRMSEALARMQLASVVTAQHVTDAYDLWYGAMQESAADEDGHIDMDVLAGSSGAHQKYLSEQLPGIVRALLTGK